VAFFDHLHDLANARQTLLGDGMGEEKGRGLGAREHRAQIDPGAGHLVEVVAGEIGVIEPEEVGLSLLVAAELEKGEVGPQAVDVLRRSPGQGAQDEAEDVAQGKEGLTLDDVPPLEMREFR